MHRATQAGRIMMASRRSASLVARLGPAGGAPAYRTVEKAPLSGQR